MNSGALKFHEPQEREKHDANFHRNLRHRSFRARIFEYGGEGIAFACSERTCESSPQSEGDSQIRPDLLTIPHRQ